MTQTYDFAKISQKLHEIERIWTPLRSATEIIALLLGLVHNERMPMRSDIANNWVINVSNSTNFAFAFAIAQFKLLLLGILLPDGMGNKSVCTPLILFADGVSSLFPVDKIGLRLTPLKFIEWWIEALDFPFSAFKLFVNLKSLKKLKCWYVMDWITD